MLKITTRWHALLFAVSGTLIAVALTIVMISAVHPPDVLAYTLYRDPVMAVCIGFPILLFTASKIRLANAMAAELEALVNRDRLTGVATRDFFFAAFENNAPVYGVSLMVDIDHFKKINDTFGHFTGDEVIRQIAAILTAECREGDLVCRFGGGVCSVSRPR